MNRSDYFVHSTAVIDHPVTIGKGTRIWHWVHVMEGARIGSECVLGQNVFIGGKVTLGNNVHVQNNVSVYDGVTLEDDVFCGPSMVFTNVINPRGALNRKDQLRPTLVKKGATIGANATVVCGNVIGEYAMIGAGAVVTREVPAFALMTGVPAKQTGWVSRNGLKLSFDDKNRAVCPESGEEYELKDNKINVLDE